MLALFKNRCVALRVLHYLGDGPEVRAALRGVCSRWRKDCLHALGWRRMVPEEMSHFSQIELVQVWRVVKFRDNCYAYSDTDHKRENGNVCLAMSVGKLCSKRNFCNLVADSEKFEAASAAIFVFDGLVVCVNNWSDADVVGRINAYGWFWATWFPHLECNNSRSLDAASKCGILTDRERKDAALIVVPGMFRL